MKTASRLGEDEVSGRELFGLQLESFDQITDPIQLSSKYFVCFLGWDSTNATTEAISQVAEILLKSGCVYICACGDGCERVHDIFDEVSVGVNPALDDDPVIMTTWHKEESLDDALWYFLNSTFPDDQYADNCHAALAVSIGLFSEYQERIEFALTSPREFSSQVLSEEEDVT